MKPTKISPELLAFAREPLEEELAEECWPMPEELLRNRVEWKKILADRPSRAARSLKSRPEPGILTLGDSVAIKIDTPGGLIDTPRRRLRKPAVYRLAVAILVAVAVGGLCFTIRSHWWQPGPRPLPEIVEKDSPPSKDPVNVIVKKGQGGTATPPPTFEDALSSLKKRLEAGVDEEEGLRAYKKLLKDYPEREDEIKRDRELALAVGLDIPPIVDNPKEDRKNPEMKPPSPVAAPSTREEFLARITAMIGKPLAVHDPKVIDFREQVKEYLKEHPEPKIPEIEAFLAASELSPRNELLYAEAKAKELENSPKDAAEVQDLRGIVRALRFRTDETRRLVLSSKSLVEFMKLTQLDDLTAKVVEMKAAVLALVDRYSSQKGRGPYLLCVLPPGLRGEADNLYKDVQAYARRSADPPDAVFVDFLTRARRSLPGDTLGVIVPTYDPNRFRIGTAVGDANWDRLIAVGNPDVPITAVVNIVINRELLLKQGINVVAREDAVFATINRAKAASITTLACLDCRPGVKSDASLTDEIDSWFQLYGNLDGYFVYGANINNFKNIYNYIRNKYGASPMIVYSATQFPAEDQIKAALADNRFVLCIEQEATSVDQFQPPSWVVKYNPSRFAGVFGGTQTELAKSVELAAAKHLGSVYLTDNGQQVPAYLPDELTLIQQLNVRIMGIGGAANPAARKKKTANPKAK
jgi:hypothetical protein